MFSKLAKRLGFGLPQIGPQEAVQRLNQGAVLVDVREPNEYANGHAPNAIHLPLARVRAQGSAAIDALALPDAVEDVLLICHSGMRSRIAQAALAGHRRVRCVNVAGGMQAWVDAGLPMTTPRG